MKIKNMKNMQKFNKKVLMNGLKCLYDPMFIYTFI